MTSLRYVWFWPNGGPRDGMWCPEGSTAVDRFARTSRRITERYSEVLASHEISATRAAIQMWVVGARDATDEVVVNVAVKQFEGTETIRVEVPEPVVGLSGSERGLLVLDVVSVTMKRLADLRNWPSSPFDQARQHVIDHRFSFEATGPWKSNRSRTLRARPVLRINDDGWGEKAFEIADARTDAPLGFTPPALTPVNSQPKFKRDTGKWRWVDAHTIDSPEGRRILPGSDPGALTRWDATDLRAWPRTDEPSPERAPLRVSLRAM